MLYLCLIVSIIEYIRRTYWSYLTYSHSGETTGGGGGTVVIFFWHIFINLTAQISLYCDRMHH